MVSDKELSDSQRITGKSARIQVVDGLRGFALFGILLIHAKSWFDGGTVPDWVEQINHANAIHTFTKSVVYGLISGKFYTLFSFLFGLSFALMVTRSKLPERVFLRRFMWRLIILGLIGFIHNLHWRGDILLIYAVVGFALIPFRKASFSLILICALFLVVNMPIRIKDIYTHLTETAFSKAEGELTKKAFNKRIEANYQVFKHGSYWEVARVNLDDLAVKIRYQRFSGNIFVTFGFFLFGLYAGRRQLFQLIPQYLPLFRKLFLYSGLAMVTLYSLRILMKVITNPSFLMDYNYLYDLLVDSSNAAFTFFYLSAFTLLFYRYTQHFIVSYLASVGKMALTNYVLQSVFGTLVFYGYGLGLMGEIGAAWAVSLSLPFFIFQLLMSHWWMSRFRYGPLEWIWRSATLLAFQPMLKQ
ncbi:DUF418 domain-containing protein [Dyadobacter pollutisoli]|uniref:DUF418 domain-containing protein n=1 Tax=Dyadobacter pollutisoli TaxID=2910158 RepID=A0A9E8NET8_9BACT|nr:DUF418 domain-containing protein [Dyadobacter pollutisoli]WAC13002.1 DUF418 domain-containing protein [Dyadobacter pollutisoli]